MPVIRIESILGGHAPSTHFASKDQFRTSIGIDPGQPIDTNNNTFSSIASGLLVPVGSTAASGTSILAPVMWIKSNPKDANIYAYVNTGSVFTVAVGAGSVTGLADGGSMSSSGGNGCSYYDNYMYFAKNTDIARYGPLNGAPAFNATYWTSDLSMTALSNTTYPNERRNAIPYPNHFLHRHVDGRLYIADVLNNQGTIHYISTAKTTVEGDANNSSTYNKLSFGFGLYPMCMESYGSDLAIALYEGNANATREERAKIAFWDTTSTSANKIVWVEFPDQIITAMKNVGGVLYVVSGNFNSRGFRVSRFVGGYTFEEVWYSEVGEPCLAGAIDGAQNRLLVGTLTTVPVTDGCVFSIGLQRKALGNGMFNVMRTTTAGSTTAMVTALGLVNNFDLNTFYPVIAHATSNGSADVKIDLQSQNNANANSVWWSQTYRIGRPFQINEIRIPLAQQVAASMIVTPKINFDDGVSSTTLTAINNTNFPNSENYVEYKVNAVGQHSFWLELVWSGQAQLTVSLPIEIEYEV